LGRLDGESAPCLQHRRHAHQGRRVRRVRVQLRGGSRDVVGGGDPFGDDGLRDPLERHRGDQLDAAVAEARLALRAFERLGAVRDADAAGDLLRRLGAAGRAWPKRFGALTKRESEVLSLLAAGCSNAEIGERLYISRRTAEHHVASILAKLGLRSRAEAAAYAVRDTPKVP
jgi:DNA-binding CsgD family transcriptional regulator